MPFKIFPEKEFELGTVIKELEEKTAEVMKENGGLYEKLGKISVLQDSLEKLRRKEANGWKTITLKELVEMVDQHYKDARNALVHGVASEELHTIWRASYRFSLKWLNAILDRFGEENEQSKVEYGIIG